MKTLLVVCLVLFSSFTFGKGNEQTVVLISIDGRADVLRPILNTN